MRRFNLNDFIKSAEHDNEKLIQMRRSNFSVQCKNCIHSSYTYLTIVLEIYSKGLLEGQEVNI